MWLCLLLLTGLGLLLQRAAALPTFPPLFRSTYHPQPGGAIDHALQACTLCHAGPGGPPFNPYGQEIHNALQQAHTKMLTPAILHALDAKDSDGDGVTNGAEIAADTLPGDPNSHPAVNGSVTKGKTGEKPPAGASTFEVIKALLFPKHAQHPVVVHFPIALFVISLLFDVLALWKRDRSLALAGYFNLLAAAIGSVAAVGTGLLAWQFAYGGAALRGTLLIHLALGITTMVLILLLLTMRLRSKDKSEPIGRLYLIIGIITILVISVAGHLGGDLSGING